MSSEYHGSSTEFIKIRELSFFEQVVESLLHTHPDLVERNKGLCGFKLSP